MAGSAEVRKQVARLPKAELHVHLRGAMPLGVLAELMEKHDARRVVEAAPEEVQAMWRRCRNLAPLLGRREWSAEDLRAIFRYEDFPSFLHTYYFTGFFVRDREDLTALISGVVEGLRSQGIVYAEITVSAIEYVEHGIPLAEVAGCLDEGAERDGIRVQWIVDLIRDRGPKGTREHLEEIIALGSRGIVGITLGGNENAFATGDFAEVYAMAREHGLRLTVHAGEAAGPESVRAAVEALGVERIGHGVRAVEDPGLVELLAERGIALEVCPTSNIHTGVYASLDEHPAKALHDAGVPVTINSDDPTFFRTDLVEECVRLRELGLSDDDLLSVLRNGFRHSFLPAEEARRQIADLERAWAAGGWSSEAREGERCSE